MKYPIRHADASNDLPGLNTGQVPVITRIDRLRISFKPPGCTAGIEIAAARTSSGVSALRYRSGAQVCERLRSTGGAVYARPQDMERVVMREWLAGQGLKHDHVDVARALEEASATA